MTAKYSFAILAIVSAANAQMTDDGDSSNLSDGEIIAITVGLLVFILLLCVGLYFLMQGAKVPSQTTSGGVENPISTPQKI